MKRKGITFHHLDNILDNLSHTSGRRNFLTFLIFHLQSYHPRIFFTIIRASPTPSTPENTSKNHSHPHTIRVVDIFFMSLSELSFLLRFYVDFYLNQTNREQHIAQLTELTYNVHKEERWKENINNIIKSPIHSYTSKISHSTSIFIVQQLSSHSHTTEYR